jgi:integrase
MIVKWKLPTYLPQDMVRDFFSAITSSRDKALFSLIYLYGLRVSEACLLHRDDIDLRRRTIRIWRVKNGNSGEKPLFKSLVPILRQRFKEHMVRQLVIDTGASWGDDERSADAVTRIGAINPRSKCAKRNWRSSGGIVQTVSEFIRKHHCFGINGRAKERDEPL